LQKGWILKSQLPYHLIPPGTAPEVLKDEDVSSDLKLLENQIQILVLLNLSQNLFPDEFDPTVQEQRTIEINKIVLSVLFYFRFRFFRISKVLAFLIMFNFLLV